MLVEKHFPAPDRSRLPRLPDTQPLKLKLENNDINNGASSSTGGKKRRAIYQPVQYSKMMCLSPSKKDIYDFVASDSDSGKF